VRPFSSQTWRAKDQVSSLRANGDRRRIRRLVSQSNAKSARRDKRRDMALVRGLAVFSGAMLFFSVNALPQDSAQDFSSFGPPQSFLREASALIPRIEKDQRSSAAANIAGQQARIRDRQYAQPCANRAT
jgi:hypothetical protein